MVRETTPFRPTKFGPTTTQRTMRDDGTIIYEAKQALESYPRCLTEKLLHWAAESPDNLFLARRDADQAWRSLTYRQTYAAVRSLGQALLNLNLPPDRTVAILSENSLEHALLALACIHVGITYSPISPPYSTRSKDFGKLRHTLELMTPGLIFAQDGQQYLPALQVAQELFPDATIAVAQNRPTVLDAVLFESLQAVSPTAAVEAAFEAITPDTVAKVLFTSGSTSMPKGVQNTHRLWCSNMQQILQSLPFIQEQHSVFLDWLPWNHTFGGNHNFGLTLYVGGSLYIDDGKPTPDGIETTVANLREIAPTIYFNVPKGFAELIPYLRAEPELRQTFFSRLEMLFYAGAALPQPVWDALEEMAAKATGYRVPIITGLGMTESGPSAMFAHWPGGYSGLLGVPVPGLAVKMVPDDDKLEARYKGPNITPGYWRQPELNGAAFDEEGFFRTGDAVKFEDENNPDRGLVFDGRIAEDFKLTSGTWVNVGILRMALFKAGAPLVQDVVVTGHNREYVGAILFMNSDACIALAGLGSSATLDEIGNHPVIRAEVQRLLNEMAKEATGSSNRIVRAAISTVLPSIDVGEITDKGSLNQRVVLRHRADVVERLYADEKPDWVFEVEI